MTKQAEVTERFIQELFECYFKPKGCWRIPVRFIWELEKDNETTLVCLCRNHAALYHPQGKVIQDATLSAENLKLFAEMDI